MAGAGMGLMLGQANTDAINRASRYSYGEATGITQTVRNYGASLGFAILGTLLITRFRSAITSSLTAQGPARARPPRRRRPRSPSCRAATATSPPSRRSSAPTSPAPPATCSTGWPSSWRSPAFVALRGLRRGVQEDTVQTAEEFSSRLPGEDPGADLDPAWR